MSWVMKKCCEPGAKIHDEYRNPRDICLHFWTYNLSLSLPHQLFQKSSSGDFPGGPGVTNLPCSARNGGSIPGQGTKIPGSVEQLSPCAEDCGVQLKSESPKLIR